MSQPSTSSDLEVLFIEKLQLKYQLNERDLKKAFSRYDKDNSGYLDIEEIGIAARLMLNGVSDEQVRNLVSRFDLNGDGTISYDEFLQYLLKRKDGPTTAAMDANDARSDRRNWNRNTMYKSQFDDYNDHSRSAARKTTEIERSTSNAQNEGYGRESSTGRRTHRQQSEGDTGRRNYQHNSGNTGGHSHQQEIDSNIGKVCYAQQNQGNRQQQERITGRRPNYQKSEGYTNRPGNKGQSNFEQNVPDDDDSQSFSLDDENNEEYDSDEGCDEFPSVNAELRGPIGDSSRQIYMKRGNPRDYDSQSTTSETPSDVASNFDPSNSSEVEYRCKAFLENLRSLLNKRVLSLRDKGALAHHLTLSNKELLEKTGCALLTKAFQNYTGGTRTRKEDQLIDLGDFIRVLREFKFPGFPPVRTEVLKYVFELCRHTPSTGLKGSTSTIGRWDLKNGSEGAADPNLLFDLIYGDSVHHIRQQQLPRNQETAAIGEQTGQRVKDQDTLKSYPDRANERRRELGRGPVRPNQNLGFEVNKDDGLTTIPLRFISRKTYTSLAVPSNFDVNLMKRSSLLPSVECVRDHVFGLSHSVSGSPVHVLSPSTGGLSKGDSGRRTSVPSGMVSLVYASAALGVIHDLATNKQTFFAGHDDDITCICLSNSSLLAATGQMGKTPVIHVWRTDVTQSSNTRKATLAINSNTAEGESDLVVTLGKGFLTRSVCAVSFCSDDTFLAGVGCDDHHSLGIWSIPSGNLVVQTVCQNGLPPQIRDLKWSPGQQFTQYITREHNVPCDLICTAGEHHIRVWSFARPAPGPPAAVIGGKTQGPQLPLAATLAYRGATMGKSAATAAKVYTCCGFIPCDEKGDKSFDMVAGGSNGVVYLWRGGELAAFTNAIKGGVLCLHVTADKLYCGGAKGVIKLLDSRTLAVLAAFSTVSPISRSQNLDVAESGHIYGNQPTSRRGAPSIPASSRPLSAAPASSKGRAASAGRVRPSSATPAAAAGGGGKGRASTSSTVSGLALCDVTGIVLVRGSAKSSASQSLSQTQSLYLIATNSDGRAVKVEVGSALTSLSVGIRGSGGNRGDTDSLSQVPVKDLFYYHTGSVWGLSTERRQGGTLIATVGEDKQLCVWDAEGHFLTCRTTVAAAAHCCHFDKFSNFIAVGTTAGSVYVYSHLVKSGSVLLSECSFRKDSSEEISDIKFSPSNSSLAVGSHDNYIIVYSCALAVDDSTRSASSGSCVLRPAHKLKGHSSYITHLDWSIDSRLIRSTCGAYELLYWDAESGKRHFDSTACDIRWKTSTCTLGFQVMGIWPKYADGTDINAVDVSGELGIVATADDSGYLNIMNFPCVVQEAPRRVYGGHSSFVQNVKFLPCTMNSKSEQRLVTVGGDDDAVILWTLSDVSSRSTGTLFRPQRRPQDRSGYGPP